MCCSDLCIIHLMKIYFHALFFVSLFLAIYGCAPKTHSIIDQEFGPDLSFLEGDAVKRQEILEHLGQPSSQYEDGRIVIYWLRKSDQGTFVATTKDKSAVEVRGWSQYKLRDPNLPETGYYNLVLIFSSHDVLERYSIVFIR